MKQRLGRYELLAELGSGGMASVWLARTRGPGDFEKRVALKRVHPHLADDARFVAMFLDEARIAACVDHPNVCSTIDFGEASSSHYLAMDLIRGRTVGQVAEALHLDGVDMTVRERCALAARIVIDAAEGLHAVHEARSADGKPLGIVHRDVAPANLMVRWDGVTQVTDFGCARAREMARMYWSADGESRGHPSYTAPETIRGAEPDRRIDVWALGVILWELLAGERLFRREAIHDTLFAIVGDDPPAPSRHCPGVPAELDRIVARALAKDPKDRFQTARELSGELREWLRGTGLAMDAPEVAARMARLFPEGDPPLHALDAPSVEETRPTRPTAVPAAPIQSGVRTFLRQLRHPLVLAAMIAGLCGGLGVTAGLTALSDEAPPVRAVHAATLPGGQPQAPRMVRVPGTGGEGGVDEREPSGLGEGVHTVTVHAAELEDDTEAMEPSP